MTSYRWLVAALFALTLPLTAARAQERGTITGSVVDATTNQPLAGAQVFLAGTTRGTLTNQQGRFVMPAVPPGDYEVRATLIGYSQATQRVTVAAGQPTTANFQLQPSAVELGAVVVTATGQQQRAREIGVAVSTINVEDVEMAAVNKMSDLLQGRSAGVSVVQSGGTTGTGARIRIRGNASVSLSNEPLLVIDGVRVDNNPTSNSIGVGGQSISRLNDINPEDIENIEILKGPAASALYGTAAANGVIQITTRKGRAGATRWNAYVETGTIREDNEYPTNFGRLGTLPGNRRTFRCTLDLISRGICSPQSDELLSFNPIEANSPFRTGSRQKTGVNVSGGSEVATYYISGDVEREQGIYPNNELQKVNLRANVRANLTPNFDLSVNSGYITNEIALPQNDNNLLGVVSGALLGYPFNTPDDFGFTRAESGGYVLVKPETLFRIDNRQNINRVAGSATANWRPMGWLSVVGTAGLDVVNRFDTETLAANVFPAIFSLDEGYRQANRIQVGNYTATTSATANWSAGENLALTTALGAQFLQEVFRGTYAFGARLLAGTGSLSGTSARFSINEVNTDVRTVGGFLQQQFAWRDRLFLTGAIRGDDNSAFGSDFGFVWYPSLTASWVVSEEPFFPELGFLSTLRLRAAAGQSGLRPTFRQAETFFDPVAARVQGQDVPAFTVGGTGNPELEPERSTEVEFGFDTGLFNERVGLELTYYNKTSNDALVQRRLAPSLGVSSTRFENVGRVRNSGLETVLRLQALRLPSAEWDLNLTASWNRNELLELGEGIEPIIFGLGGSSQRHQPGFPLGAYFERTIDSFNDANGNGIIERSEVQLTDTSVYLGSPFPTREISLNTNATLFRFMRFSALLDYKGGYKLHNQTRYFRCASSFANCREAFDRTAPLEEQARFIAGLLGARGQYVEDADFLKLRELSLTLQAPDAWNRRFGVDGLSLTLSGRNLATWTDYTGLDPELNYAGQSNFATADFLTQPPVEYYIARVNVNF